MTSDQPVSFHRAQSRVVCLAEKNEKDVEPHGEMHKALVGLWKLATFPVDIIRA